MISKFSRRRGTCRVEIRGREFRITLFTDAVDVETARFDRNVISLPHNDVFLDKQSIKGLFGDVWMSPISIPRKLIVKHTPCC